MSLTSLQVGDEPPSASLDTHEGSLMLQPSCSPVSISVEGEKRTIPRLFEFPHEILLMIHSFLPLPSQACLALTRKSLYNVFISSVKHPDLAWPKEILEQGSAAYALPKINPRTQLLLQLQTLDNPFCVTCLKLHRRNEFPQNLPDILGRKCRFGDNVVDLCHCLALTPMTGAKLREWLRRGIAPTSLDRSILTAFRLMRSEDNQLSFRHVCNATNRQYGALSLHMQVRLMAFAYLVVCTRHSLAITVSDVRGGWEQLLSPFSPTESVFGCPHRNLMHIGWYNHDMAPERCDYCKAAFSFAHHELPKSVFEWVTYRCLGSDSDHAPWEEGGRCLSVQRGRVENYLKLM